MATSKSIRKNLSSPKDIASWIKRETFPIRNALETASKHFDKNDSLDVYTLEAVYAKESGFGRTRGKPNSSRAAGDFQIKKNTAIEIGLRIDKSNDERFDINHSAAAAAKLLKQSDHRFEKSTTLYGEIKTIAVKNPEKRKRFTLAAYNAGDSRIAKAQQLTKANGEDPENWDQVQKYLEEAGATKRQAEETRDYVEKAANFEKDFGKKSQANPNVKFDKSKRITTGGHWVTIKGRHILIKDK